MSVLREVHVKLVEEMDDDSLIYYVVKEDLKSGAIRRISFGSDYHLAENKFNRMTGEGVQAEFNNFHRSSK